jgi:hypothetical protein
VEFLSDNTPDLHDPFPGFPLPGVDGLAPLNPRRLPPYLLGSILTSDLDVRTPKISWLDLLKQPLYNLEAAADYLDNSRTTEEWGERWGEVISDTFFINALAETSDIGAYSAGYYANLVNQKYYQETLDGRLEDMNKLLPRTFESQLHKAYNRRVELQKRYDQGLTFDQILEQANEKGPTLDAHLGVTGVGIWHDKSEPELTSQNFGKLRERFQQNWQKYTSFMEKLRNMQGMGRADWTSNFGLDETIIEENPEWVDPDKHKPNFDNNDDTNFQYIYFSIGRELYPFFLLLILPGSSQILETFLSPRTVYNMHRILRINFLISLSLTTFEFAKEYSKSSAERRKSIRSKLFGRFNYKERILRWAKTRSNIRGYMINQEELRDNTQKFNMDTLNYTVKMLKDLLDTNTLE